ncbi:MAG: hypothetical protein GXP62_17570 [Oligoflexia bacterium]|nr:hypothetical protein [Oligoflexia bacterium]
MPSLIFAALIFAALLSSLGAPAWAGDAQCQQCCNDAGLYSCPTWLRLFGPGSHAKKDVGGIRVTGIWRLDCETGARFEEAGTVVMATTPSDGDVLLVGSPTITVECFANWCGLPQGACLQTRSGGAMALLGCTDAMPLTASQLVTVGPPAAAVYVPPTPIPNPGTDAARSPSTAPNTPRPNPYAVRPPSPTQVTTVVVAPQAAPAPTPNAPHSTDVDPTTVIIEQSGPVYPPHLPAEGPLAVTMDYDLPAPPGSRCQTSDAVAAEATRHLDIGDDARLRDDNQQAADEYRAAVTLDRCNAIAWAALGQLALASDHVVKAVQALDIAVALRPDHYGALTSLGLALEASGRCDQAIDAFQRALAVRPGHPAAEDGLARCQ